MGWGGVGWGGVGWGGVGWGGHCHNVPVPAPPTVGTVAASWSVIPGGRATTISAGPLANDPMQPAKCAGGGSQFTAGTVKMTDDYTP